MEQNKKIAVIGGAGKSGKYIVKQLLNQGYYLKLLLRNPNNFKIASPLIEIVAGDVRDYQSVLALVAGCQAIISTLGQPKGEPTIFSQATKNVLRSMNEYNIQRYILITGLSVDAPEDNKSSKVKFATEWMKTNYPEVVLMSTLYKQHKSNVNNYNHLQLLVYANAENFLSTHGGTSVLASYFGGTNIVLSKEGPQVYFKCFEKIYPKLSGAQVFHAKTDEEFKRLVDQVYFPKNNTVAV